MPDATGILLVLGDVRAMCYVCRRAHYGVVTMRPLIVYSVLTELVDDR